MDFAVLKIDDSGPVYLQVIRFIKKSILNGSLSSGDELPSRRIMAATLSLNLTTVQKIYKQLDAEGLIDTLPNSKTYVTVTNEKMKEIEQEIINEYVKRFIEEMKECNVDKQRLIELMVESW